MGVFYSKLLESDVEDAIQTPDDVGVDLDAIEDAIVGKDGIEAHRDEIEAAEEGVVGDPLEEAAVIMYESEYNFNQLMKCIGIAELNEMAAGRDFILEAGSANAASFWEKTKQLFTRMFESITKVFSNVVHNISAAMPSDKQFVAANEHYIRNGAAKATKFKDLYDFDYLMMPYRAKETNLDVRFEDALNNTNWTKDGDSHITNAGIIAAVAPNNFSEVKKASDAKEFASKLHESYFVKKDAYGGEVVDQVIGIMKKDGDIKNIRDSYKLIKDQYSKLFKALNKMKSSFNKKTEDGAHSNSVCVAYIAAIKYEKNLQHTYFATVLKAHKTARAQARHMALKWRNEGAAKPKGDKKNKEANAEVQHNSALFNIDII